MDVFEFAQRYGDVEVAHRRPPLAPWPSAWRATLILDRTTKHETRRWAYGDTAVGAIGALLAEVEAENAMCARMLK